MYATFDDVTNLISVYAYTFKQPNRYKMQAHPSFGHFSKIGTSRTSRPFRHVVGLTLAIIGAVQVVLCLPDIRNVLHVRRIHESLAAVGAPSESTKSNRILIFITTHLSDLHYTYLENCWPALIAKSPLFKQSDFMIFITEPEGQKANMTLINSVFAETGISVHSTENPGYQEGAILAFTEAIENHWFDKYDWVIRVNPDVMIREDNFLLERFQDSRIHGVFVDCLDRDCPTGNRCADSLIHTDFFAVRPNAISLSAVREMKQNNAEVMTTEMFSSIVQDGADAWVPGAGPQRGICRVVGKSSPVIHTHDFGAVHPACLFWYG